MKMRVQPKSSLSLLTETLEPQHPPWGRGAGLVYLNYISLFMACGGAPTFSCRGQASLSQNSAAARERGCQPGKGIWIGLHSLHLLVGGTFSLRFKRIFSGTMEYCVCVSVAQLCLTLCDPMDCSLPGSSVHGINPARILEGAPMPSFRGSSPPRDCFLHFLHWQVDSLPLRHLGSPN